MEKTTCELVVGPLSEEPKQNTRNPDLTTYPETVGGHTRFTPAAPGSRFLPLASMRAEVERTPA